MKIYYGKAIYNNKEILAATKVLRKKPMQKCRGKKGEEEAGHWPIVTVKDIREEGKKGKGNENAFPEGSFSQDFQENDIAFPRNQGKILFTFWLSIERIISFFLRPAI